MPVILSRKSGGSGGGGAPSGPAGGSLAGTYPNPSIAAGAVDTTEIANDAVEAAQIAAGAVGRSELAAGIGVFDLLSDTTLGADADNFDISGISQSYKHLLVIGVIRMATGTAPLAMSWRFNNDSSALYDSHLIQVSNTTVTGTRTAAGTSAGIWLGTSADAAANMYAANECLVTDYTNSSHFKQFVSRASAFSDTAADSLSWSGGGYYRSTSAITRITILQGATQMESGSRLTIYGLG